jgi:flagellar biogenesis protein FliO
MSPDAPTTLHVPTQEPPVTAQPLLSVGAWVLVVIPILIAFLWVLARLNRSRHRRPEDHAFFALAKRLGLHRDQVQAVRAYAQRVANCEPIEVLMNEQMLASAIGEPV